MPEASGEFGEAPSFTWPDGCAPEGLQVEVLSEGDGREVGAGAAVLANYAGYVWGSDTQFDSSYERGAPTMFSLNSVIDGWATGIPGAAVGSRLLISVPPDLGYGPSGGNASAGIGATDTIVFVVDVVETFNASDAGESSATPVADDDLPVTIDGDLGEAAAITIADGAPDPEEAAIYRVADGSGEALAPGQSVAVAFTVTYWDGSGTQTTWSPAFGEAEDASPGPGAGPIVSAIGHGSIFDLLEGVPVGSRVVLVAPASGQEPAVAVLVDVLAAA